MTGLPPFALLDVLERGAGGSAPERALTVLREASVDDVDDLSPGGRDVALLGVRRALLGDAMSATAACKLCGETLELTFSVADLVVAPARDRPGTRSVVSGEHEVEVRLPSALELVAAAAHRDAERAERELLACCVVSARRGEEALEPAALPREVVDAIDAELAGMDPQGALDVRTTCPACEAEQSVAFDAAAFVCAEVEWAALRLLAEVHDLATAYGWSERDVLGLPAGRRRRYLELVRQ